MYGFLFKKLYIFNWVVCLPGMDKAKGVRFEGEKQGSMGYGGVVK